MRKFEKTSSKKAPTLRRSQTVTTFGVGAIADLPDASVMICGIDKWDIRGTIPIGDPRLEKKLGVKLFRMAPDSDSPGDGVAAVRFPRWMRCRKKQHGALMSLEDWRQLASGTSRMMWFDDKPYCYLCNLALIPSRFVVACRKGHIDDFPFIEWAHGGSKEVCEKPRLKYAERGNSASLSGIWITCECGKSKSMGGSFNKDTMENIVLCKGAMPWEKVWADECGEKLTTLQRGGTNVHFPILKSSILIPPHSTDSLKTKIASTLLWAAYESQDDPALLQSLLQPIAEQVGEPIDKVREVIDEMTGDSESSEGDGKSEEDYRYEEYRAFLGEYDKELNNKRDFLVEKQDISRYSIPFVKSVVLAKKLREIRVQTGFSRIRPLQSTEEEPTDNGEKIESMPVALSKKTRWLPGYEVRGEGIFLEFDGLQLNEWAKRPVISAHYKNLLARSTKSPDSFGIVNKLTPEFVLLHTISHSLIRQLSFECGYSSSALRERLYCTSDNSGNQMYGMLIYTAEGDSDGTLGGLVRQGEPDLFPNTLLHAIADTRWCSSDPLCIESGGQGYQSLNLAACHSCCMLPETSCELINRYLDRASIVGTISNPTLGLFSDELKQQEAKLG
jgi:hypothetical protein